MLADNRRQVALQAVLMVIRVVVAHLWVALLFTAGGRLRSAHCGELPAFVRR